MPFIRYSRDKRGYETTVVMHAYRSPQGAQRNRVLYVFRSPSSLKVGRRALDEEVMEALEHTHPDLTFDWSSLQRDMGGDKPDYREREPVRRPPQRRPEPQHRPAPPQETPAPTVVDESPLGRALGAATAARLRNQYNDLSQRISRRARTPEERDRLIERLTRLNPDDWADEATIRANASSVETEWSSIAAELPQRRRGRRGGRQRREGATGRPGGQTTDQPGLEGQPGEASGIMLEQGEIDAAEITSGVAGEDRGPDAVSDSSRDSAGDGPEHTAADTGTSDPTDRLHEDG